MCGYRLRWALGQRDPAETPSIAHTPYDEPCHRVNDPQTAPVAHISLLPVVTSGVTVRVTPRHLEAYVIGDRVSHDVDALHRATIPDGSAHQGHPFPFAQMRLRNSPAKKRPDRVVLAGAPVALQGLQPEAGATEPAKPCRELRGSGGQHGYLRARSWSAASRITWGSSPTIRSPGR